MTSRDRVQPNLQDKELEELDEINLGINEAPKKVYIGKKMSSTMRKPLIELLRKYMHVFAWSYDDLKAYRKDLFKHVIPLKKMPNQ